MNKAFTKESCAALLKTKDISKLVDILVSVSTSAAKNGMYTRVEEFDRAYYYDVIDIIRTEIISRAA